MAKSIERSVGVAGRNLPRDVVTVQYLLNCIPLGNGGPFPELAVDGLVGPKTTAAIMRFQHAAFGRADGRVDPGQRTIQTLVGYDPYPNQVVAVPSTAGAKSAGLHGKGAPGQKTPSGTAWTKSSFGGSSGKSGGSLGKSGLGGAWGKGLPGKSGGWGKSV